MQEALQQILDGVRRRDPDQVLFHQAVEEFLTSLSPFLREHPEYLDRALFEQLFAEELEKIRLSVGEEVYQAGKYRQAAALLEDLVSSEAFIEFLTLPAAAYLEQRT